MHTPAKAKNEALAMISQSLPMAAMFMRNKTLSWTAFFLAVQTYLNEPHHKTAKEKENAQPPLLKVTFALISLLACYIELIFPAMSPHLKQKQALDAAKAAAELASTVASAAAETAAETAVETAKAWWPF